MGEVGGGVNQLSNCVCYNLKSLEFNVIRFWNSDIDNNIESVFEIILKSLE